MKKLLLILLIFITGTALVTGEVQKKEKPKNTYALLKLEGE